MTLHKLMLLKLLVILFLVNATGQEARKDSRRQSVIEDPTNSYDSESISKIDILKSLESLGARIFKVDLTRENETSTIKLLSTEYKNSRSIAVDTIATISNEYYYSEFGQRKPYIDYLKEFTIFTNTSDNASELQFDFTNFITNHKIVLDNTSKGQFFELRRYKNSYLKKNSENNILIFGSSWMEPGENYQKFCGAVFLNEDDPMTLELLDNSPHFFIISFIIE